MGIYRWDNGARLYSYKGQAVITAKPGQSADEVNSLIQGLEAAGYTVVPTEISSGLTHEVRFHDLASIDPKLLDYLKERVAVENRILEQDHNKTVRTINGSSLTPEQKAREISELGKPSFASIEVGDNSITIKGLHEERVAHEFFRMGDLWDSIGKGHTEHKAVAGSSAPGLRLTGVRDDEALIRQLEKANWGTGFVRDEFYGLNPVQKNLAKLLNNADVVGPILYGFGDSRILLATIDDARRLGISPLAHPRFGEGAGFLSGSIGWLINSVLKRPGTVKSVVDRLDQNFRVGDEVDFNKAINFGPDGKDLGAIPRLGRTFLADGGRFVMMLANLWAGSSLIRGRNEEVLSTETIGNGHVNVKLDEVTGEIARTKKLKPQAVFSGLVLMFSASIFAFMPRRGVDHPDFDYANISDSLRDKPIIGGIWRAANKFFTQNSFGKTIGAPWVGFWDHVSKDPFGFGGPWITAHNAQQIAFNAKDLFEVRAKMAELRQQVADYRGMVDANIADPKNPLPLGEGGKPVHFEGEELARVQKALKDMLEHGTDFDHKAPRYSKPGSKEYQAKLQNPETYLDYYQQFKEKQKDNRQGLSEADRYIGMQAANLLNLNEYEQINKTAFGRFFGYSNMLLAATTLANADKNSTIRNAAMGVNDLLVTTAAAAEWVKSKTGDKQLTDDQITNVAKSLSQDREAVKNGWGVEVIQRALTARLRGETLPEEQQMLDRFIHAQAVETNAAPSLEDQSLMAAAAKQVIVPGVSQEMFSM
ncbi:hypothetical protein GC177_00170 [bacterium]|nr:hypothetical protein [bacterium]